MPKDKPRVEISDAVWAKLKTEYVTTDISLRALAKKYGVPYTAVQTRSQTEKWMAEREKVTDKTLNKSIERLSDAEADKIVRAIRIGDKMLDKIEASLACLDDNDRTGLKQLTSALKDLKEMKIFVNEMDKREQRARIAKLEKEAEEEKVDTTITVRLEGSLDEYGN